MAREHIRAFGATPGVEIAGIHSRTRSYAETLASEFGIPTVCGSISELYETAKPDLVVVTVSESAMVSVSKACIEFPWSVFLEKPPGLTVEDTEDIHAFATKNDSRVFVALNRRFLSSTQTVLKDIRQSQAPRFIKVQDQENQEQARALGHPPEVVENWMYANSIHVIDYFLTFGRGNVAKVTPAISWDPGAPAVVVATIEFDSGDIGLYEGIWNGPGPWAVTVSTPEKRWEMRPLEQARFQLAGQRVTEDVTAHSWDSDYKPGFRLQAENAAAAAMGQASHTPTLEQSLETMRLIRSIYQEAS